MPASAIQAARDYNRGLTAPVRWAHVGLAGAAVPVAMIWRWAGASQRRAWAQPFLLVLAALAVFPLDGLITDAARWIGSTLGGDLRRQLHWLQEYGQLGAVVLVALVIWLQDRASRVRLLDWLGGILVAAAMVIPSKVLIGRPRPKFDDPGVLLGPFGAYPMGPGKGIRHAWEVWGGISSDLWSMPSSHTAYAAVMSVFLAAVYPRLRVLVAILVVIVGVCRVLFISHYASDVLAGGAVGLLAARLMVDGGGQRLFARFWGPRDSAARGV
jgi:membrane-associated phospholipid phosphatase